MTLTFSILILLISGGGQTVLTHEDFRRAVTSYIDGHLGNKGIEREIEFRSLPKEMKVPKGEVALRVLQSQPFATKGYVGIPVEVMVNGKNDCVVLCSVYIRTFENVFVVVKDVEKGTSFDETWALLRRVETTKFGDGDLITFRRQMNGMRTRRMVKKNTVLRTAFLEEIPDVQQNGMVSVLVKSRNVTIRAAGIARQEGCIGDEIKIQRLGTKEILTAKIVGKNIVEVVLP